MHWLLLKGKNSETSNIMKKIYLLFIGLVGILTSCYKPANELCVPCYITDDYEYIIDQCGEDFQFYAANIEFDRTLDNKGALAVVMNTIFEANGTRVVITHTLDTTLVTYSFGKWNESEAITTEPAIRFDSCMSLVKNIRPKLNTKYVTLCRPLDSSNSWWIFGDGELIMDGETGEILKQGI